MEQINIVNILLWIRNNYSNENQRMNSSKQNTRTQIRHGQTTHKSER